MHRSLFDLYRYPENFRNSEDLPVFSYILANFECGTINCPINKIYKHTDSLRHNPDHAIAIGTDIVDEVFDPARISTDLIKYRKAFFAQRCLSLFRTLSTSNKNNEANRYYWMAIKSDWKSILKISYLRKFLKNIIT